MSDLSTTRDFVSWELNCFANDLPQFKIKAYRRVLDDATKPEQIWSIYLHDMMPIILRGNEVYRKIVENDIRGTLSTIVYDDGSRTIPNIGTWRKGKRIATFTGLNTPVTYLIDKIMQDFNSGDIDYLVQKHLTRYIKTGK